MSDGKIAGKSITVALLSGVSKLTGLVREMAVAALLGASARADLLYLAFQIPNTARRLLSEGMFSSVFVPDLADRETRDPETVAPYIQSILFRAAVFGAFLSIAGMLIAPLVVRLLQPGIAPGSARTEAVLLTRIMFGYVFFMCVAMVLRAVFEHARLFAIPAMLPLLFNAGVLTCIFPFRSFLGNVEFAFAVGIVAGGVLQVASMFFFLGRTGVRFSRNQGQVRSGGCWSEHCWLV